MKRIMLMLLPVSLIAFLSGCSLFVKEVDYQPIANDLNKKNMDEILNAVDGYAEISQNTFVITTSPENQNEIKKDMDKVSFWGVYNTTEDNALGTGQITVESGVEMKDTKEQIKEEKSPEFPVIYSDNQYINGETNEGLDLTFMIDKLQGIEKIVPTSYEYGLDRPPRIFYDLSEQEFSKILNDDLKIKYDKFQKATIFIRLREEERKKLFIPEIVIEVKWEKIDDNGRIIGYEAVHSTYFGDNNLEAKRGYKKIEEDK